jgi:uncharacterized protein (DUF2249 family)
MALMSSQIDHLPVTATDRVSDVIARDESLVEVFVRHSPHFTKLRNRNMRRIMGRLVTIADAAKIASIPAANLVRDLNVALGITDASAPVPDPDDDQPPNMQPLNSSKHPSSAPVVEVDVREDLRAGREPFSRIMSAVGALGENEVLHLRAIFEPAPLFALMTKRGLLHESVAHAPDDWSVWFWKPDADKEREPQEIRETSPSDSVRPATSNDVELDVRGLLPPEPMLRTLAALETLAPGSQLVQINARVPQFLLPILAERGFACDVDESNPDRVLVRIWRAR